MRKKNEPGHAVLFYRARGAGKKASAMLLGDDSRKDPIRLALSRSASKFIKETEKGLSRLFDKIEGQDVILLFDEADAIFGKRTEVRDSHDRFANQETAPLLKRIESHAGIVMLTTNLRTTVDAGFVRRLRALLRSEPTSSKRAKGGAAKRSRPSSPPRRVPKPAKSPRATR